MLQDTARSINHAITDVLINPWVPPIKFPDFARHMVADLFVDSVQFASAGVAHSGNSSGTCCA